MLRVTISIWSISFIYYRYIYLCWLFLGLCLNCYECQSKDDTVCLDPFSDERKDIVGDAECDPKATHCVKYKTVMHLLDSGFITGRARGKDWLAVDNHLLLIHVLFEVILKLKGLYQLPLFNGTSLILLSSVTCLIFKNYFFLVKLESKLTVVLFFFRDCGDVTVLSDQAGGQRRLYCGGGWRKFLHPVSV